MNDTYGSQAVLAIVEWLMILLPLALMPFAWKIGGSGMDAMYKGGKKMLGNAASAVGKAGKKGAMNTKYGQAAQQFMGNRKSISALKGRETLRKGLNSDPRLARLMGGIGGGDIATRFLDKENRAKRAEDIKNLQSGLTANVAGAIGSGEDMRTALDTNKNRTGKWADAQGRAGQGRDITAEDRAAFAKLEQQGFVDPTTGHARNDSMLATAAMQSVMKAEIAGDSNIRGLAGMLKGASAEENADFTNELRSAASASGYKNFAASSVTDGVLSKYYNKTGELEADPSDPKNVAANIAQRTAGAKKVIASGVRGINKDAFDASHDSDFLNAVNEIYSKDLQTADEKKAFVIKLADQTSHIDKDEVLKGIVKQMTDQNGVQQVTFNDFKAIQQSLKSGGAVPLPTGFSAAPAAQPQPTAVSPPIVGGPAPSNQAQGGLFIPHGTAQATTTPPQAPPIPPPQRPPRGPAGPTAPGSGPGRP